MKAEKIVIILFLSITLIGCSVNENDYYSLIPVKNPEGWGFVNQQGEFVIEPQFDNINFSYEDGVFSDGLTLFTGNNGNSGFINSEGYIVIDPIYSRANPFREEIAIVVKENEYPKAIDINGKVLFDIPCVNFCGSFYDGMAIIQKGDKYGFINKTGQIQITPQFMDVRNFYLGVAPAQSFEENNKWGLIDRNGKWILMPQFDRIENFSNNGLAPIENDKKYGFIETNGKIKINPRFDQTLGFSQDLSACKKNGTWGYIDKTGSFIINPQFKEGNNFHFGYAKVQLEDGKWGLIDKTGKFVIQPIYSWLSNVYENVVIFEKDSLYGILNIDGTIIQKPIFSKIKNDDISPRYLLLSDYFDYKAILDNIVIKCSDNMYFGISKNMSAEYIYKNRLANISNVNITKNGIIVEKPELLSENITLLGYALGFNDPLSMNNMGTSKIDRIVKIYSITFLDTDQNTLLIDKIFNTLQEKYKNIELQDIPGNDYQTQYYRFYNNDFTFFLEVNFSIPTTTLTLQVYFK